MVKRLLFSSSLLLLCCSVMAQVSLNEIRFLEPIAGNWVMKTKRSTFREVWTKIGEGSWQGTSWRIVGSDSVKQDEMTLRLDGDAIYYSIAAVQDATGQPVLYKLRVLKKVGFVAENLEASYPQKIIYRFKDGKHMDAHFEGKHEKTFSEIILQYVRE
jgi:hypothetical protein